MFGCLGSCINSPNFMNNCKGKCTIIPWLCFMFFLSCIVSKLFLDDKRKVLLQVAFFLLSFLWFMQSICLSSQSFFLPLQDWDTQNASQIVTELCGFVTILSGTFLLHKTKDMGGSPSPTMGSPVFHTSPNANPCTRQPEL